MKNLISVVVPIYNVEKFLPTCLESIALQTYQNLQVILVDDGSTDRSGEIADKFASKDNRFVVVHQSNRGQSAARNAGLQQVTGDFIAFVDADDFLTNDFYQTLLENIGKADVLQIGYTRTDVDGKPLFAKIPCNNYQFVSPCCRLYDAVFFKKNQLQFPEGQIYEDVLFSVDLWRAKPQIKRIKYAGYFYRTTPNSTTSKLHDTHQVFATLSEKLRLVKRTDCLLRLRIRYLQIRLKLHFLFQKP